MNIKDPHNRRASFKLPPSSRPGTSQETRRRAALELQRKRREKKVEAGRNLDFFSSLALNAPPEDFIDETNGLDGVVYFNETTASNDFNFLQPPSSTPSSFTSKKLHPRTTSCTKAPHRYANKLMYAELLEMRPRDLMSMDEGTDVVNEEDALPEDLEASWVALAPVPAGKRCMAVSYTLSGYGGGSLTALHSRLTGHLTLRFASSLPPDTIIDCILDERWQETGLLHVLDCMRWRGTDMSQCEAEFRLWFLHSRLAELPQTPPPHQPPYKQPYTLLPVPFAPAPLSPSILLLNVLPLAKAGRIVPLLTPTPPVDAMAVDEFGRAVQGDSLEVNPAEVAPQQALISSDGMLLHLSASTYSSGPTPLSCWVPNRVLEGEGESRLDVFERHVRARLARHAAGPNGQEVQMTD